MLEAIEADPKRWRHAEAWAARMRAWAAGCERIIVLSKTQVARAEELLGLAEDRCVLVPNGFDPRAFHTLQVDRRAHWRRYLVDDAARLGTGRAPGLGALHGRRPGGVRGRARPDAGAPVRRALHRGQAAAAADRGVRERPAGVRDAGRRWCSSAASRESGRASTRWRRSGAPARRTCSWRAGTGTRSCPSFLAASDVVVLPSVREQFGQVLVEGMACGLPAIAVDAWGPADIVDARRDGLAGRAGRSRVARQRARPRRQLPDRARPSRPARGRRGERALRLAGAGARTLPRPMTPRAAAADGGLPASR